MQNKNNDPKAKTLEELVVEIKSVVKVNKGGRQRRCFLIENSFIHCIPPHW